MSKLYVDVEQLRNVLRDYMGNPSEVEEKLNIMNQKEIASSMSIHEKRELLDNDSDVFAVQIWQREDIHAALRSMGIYNADTVTIDRIMTEAAPVLEDCSDGWSKLQSAIHSCGLKETN